MKSFLDELSGVALSLSEKERTFFSAPFKWVSLANGDADFHDNVIFLGFENAQTDPVLVAKVPRLPENGWMLKTEYDHLVELWDCIGEEAVHYVPKPYALASIQERPALMISYIPGESLTRLSRKSFWGNSNQVSALAKEAARTLRELNQLTRSLIQEESERLPGFQKKADMFRELFQVRAAEGQALSALTEIIDERYKTASHKVLIQGDFWHGNMIRNQKLGKLMFIDWQFARWSVDVSLDVYFFLLAGALSATGRGDVVERAKSAYQLLREWRAEVIPNYLSAYGTPDGCVLLPQKYGMMLCCVEKAVRPALEFGYSHPDDLMWRHLFAELQNWQES